MAATPKIGSTQIKLLEELCAACAISGQESEVRKIVQEKIKGLADDVREDALGNLLVTKKGSSRARLRVMVAAHMDEVGFMITGDEKDGIYRFATVGGLDARQLIGKTVIIGKSHTPGVIGYTPIHLTTASERRRTPSIKSLRIDTGNGGGTIKVGSRATFAPNFIKIGSGVSRTIRSKALDNRVGVAMLIELLKNTPPNIILQAAFTTQEEIGLRGAKVAGHSFDPDLAIALDCSPARDLPHWDGKENHRYNTRLGFGPAIYTTDGSTLNDPRLIRHLEETAAANGIPYQLRQPGGGGTDAGAIHKARAGIPTVSVSVPGRYIHTAAALMRVSDWNNTLKLVYTALASLKPSVLKSERS